MLLRLLPNHILEWNLIEMKNDLQTECHEFHSFILDLYFLFIQIIFKLFSVANQKSSQNYKYSKCLIFSGEINKEIARFSYACTSSDVIAISLIQ